MWHLVGAAVLGALLHKHKDQVKKAFGSPNELLKLMKRVYQDDLSSKITKLVAAAKVGKDVFLKQLNDFVNEIKEQEGLMRKEAGLDESEEEASKPKPKEKEKKQSPKKTPKKKSAKTKK